MLRRLSSTSTSPIPMDIKRAKKFLIPLAVGASLFISSLLIFNSFPFLALLISSASHRAALQTRQSLFVESKLPVSPTSSNQIPRLAYLISGSVGDGPHLRRTLRALYHPINRYVLHIDLEAPPSERLELAEYVRNDPVYARFGNVRVVAKSNLVTYRGSTMVANTLHAAAILLSEGGDWDWFINLSASDYPLITQDDLLHTLSAIPRHLNFIEHTSDMGWKEDQRAKPVMIDPGLYQRKKSDVFFISERRSTPTAFKLFTGSAWMMLSRPFIEFCIWGWDNLPRTVLMYFANIVSSPEAYFHTVICNAPEFRNTTVNHDLHFISWDNPPKQHPHFLSLVHYKQMVDSNAPFARKFNWNDQAVLDQIDKELLHRDADGFPPGGWIVKGKTNASDPEYVGGNSTVLRPGPGSERLKHLITSLISAKDFDKTHCI